METISPSLLTFLVNSLWQIPVAAAVAALICWCLRQGPASHRHAVWVAALVAAIALPLFSMRMVKSGGLEIPPPGSPAAAVATTGTTVHPSAHALPGVTSASAPRTVSIARTAAAFLLALYFLFVLFRLARLAGALLRTFHIRRTSHTLEIPVRLDRIRVRCEEAFGLDGVELLVSARISGPVAAGRAIILPESLLAETSDDVLTSAIGHEMAHVARRDFAGKLLYEILLLPMSFHPAAWLIRRGIERTREMACDELVTRVLLDAGVYARSIVSIAAQMTALRSPGYTLGVFDGDVLEERIRRLMAGPSTDLKRGRLLLTGGLAALALCAVLASSIPFAARAQGAAGDMMKQGQAASDRGDYQTASAQFAAAVRFEPDNLEAKLALAGTLLRLYSPGTDPSSPLLTEAKRQYEDVLAREPGNQRATKGMMMLHAYSKQLGEAYQWAQKAIQLNPGCVDCYYMAGFLDWSLSYPDYMSTRQVAGMKPPEPGVIPDAGMRQKLRAQHGAQIEDGLRSLQTALAFNPSYVDAMAYLNLLYRIKAAMVDDDAESQALIGQADDWVKKALNAKRAQAAQSAMEHPAKAGSTYADSLVAPPPPPPPPPPGQGRDSAAAMAPGRIRVEGAVQQGMLISQTPPAYPPLAALSHVTGTVQLSVMIGKDGSVQNIQVMNGHPLLTQAAIDAVKTWKYKPVLLNGQPVEVQTSIHIGFSGQ